MYATFRFVEDGRSIIVQFEPRHLVQDRKTVLAYLDQFGNASITVSYCHPTDSYSRRKGILVCLQKIIDRIYGPVYNRTLGISSILEYRFDYVLEVDVLAPEDRMWWTKDSRLHSSLESYKSSEERPLTHQQVYDRSEVNVPGTSDVKEETDPS